MTRLSPPFAAFAGAADLILNVLYPPRCMGCGGFLSINSGISRLSPEKAMPLLGTGDFDRLLAGWLCGPCRESLAPLTQPFCTTCGEEFKSRIGSNHLCGACAADPPPFDRARSVFFYEEALAFAIQNMKYRGRMELGRPLGLALADAFLRFLADAPPYLAVPVPLHRARLRKRGFNQVLLLVADWAKFSGFPPLVPDALKRLRPTPAQATLDRAHRAANVRKAFAVNRPELVEGKNILLLDDVYTTGATSRECAKVLKKAGAARVDVLTLARVAAG